MTQVEITLEACEPMELFRSPTPEGVWLRLDTLEGPPSGFPFVTVTGPEDAVRQFILDHWGEDDAKRV